MGVHAHTGVAPQHLDIVQGMALTQFTVCHKTKDVVVRITPCRPDFDLLARVGVVPQGVRFALHQIMEPGRTIDLKVRGVLVRVSITSGMGDGEGLLMIAVYLWVKFQQVTQIALDG
jgi:hypothetical protein